MRCRRCQSDMQQETILGFEPRWICVNQGCPKGRFRRLDPGREAPFDTNREQVRGKIERLLALAASTTFVGEAESARALAVELAAKHGVGISG